MTTESEADAADSARSSTRDRLRTELAAANKTIVDADALIAEADGFQWVDPSKLPAAFIDYYAGLRTTGYALGAW